MKGYQIVVTIFIALLVVGVFCFKPPELPRWDIEVAIPFFQGGFHLLQLLDPERFQIAPDSSVNFSQRFPIDTVRPDVAVELISVDEMGEITLADFLFANFRAGQVKVELSELLGLQIPDTGMKMRLEPFEKRLARDCSFPDIERVEVVEGVVKVTVFNNTALVFDSVVVVSPLEAIRFERVEPGAAVSRRMAVGGVFVTAPMRLELVFGSAGTGPDSIKMAKADSVVVRCLLDSARISGGRVRVPQAVGRRRCPVRLATSRPMRIDSLVLSQGKCDFTLTNRFAIPIEVHLEAPRLGIRSDRPIEQFGSEMFRADLERLVVSGRGPKNTLFDFLVTARVGPCSSFIELSKQDGMTIGYSTSELRVGSVVGEFREPVYVASRVETLPRMPFGVRGLRLSHVELALDLANSVGFPIGVGVKFQAHRDGRVMASRERRFLLEPGRLDRPVWSSGSMELTDLVNTGPDFITFEFVASLIGQGFFDAGSCVMGTALMSAPLRLALVPDTVELGAQRITLTDFQRQQLNNHLVGGAVQVSVSNRVGVGLGGRLVIVPDSTAVRDSATVVDSLVLPFAVPAGKLDCHGNCVAGRDTLLTIELDSSQVSLFKTRPLLARVFCELPQSDTVMVRASDGAGISALVKLRVRIKEQ
ncbi:MAG: hypothetical protein ABIK44_01070 [candidate division WOR-3 bacterium]